MTSDGLLAHRVEGEGEPLLLLNGGLMTYAGWEPISSRLRENYRLILCDLRGQLLSPGAAPRDLAGNVADLRALLEHLEVDSAHVLGTSYGGEIGLLLAALEPERVRALVGVTVFDYPTQAMRSSAEKLCALLGDGSDPAARARFHDRLVADVYSEAFKERFGAKLAERRAQVVALPDAWFGAVDGILGAAAALDLRPHLASIRAPTLIVIAAGDRVIPPERSLALVAAISGAEVRIHESSGHALVAEDPDWLASVSLEFLARHAAAGTDRPPD